MTTVRVYPPPSVKATVTIDGVPRTITVSPTAVPDQRMRTDVDAAQASADAAQADATQALADAAAVSSALDAHEADTVGAHAASAIAVTPAGGLAATDVQGALVELDGEVTAAQSAANAAQADVDALAGTVGSITIASLGGDAAGTARPPTAHAASHASDGSDAVSPAAIGAAAASHTHGASDIASGTIADARLPGRLRTSPQTVTDANDAADNGWYIINGSTGANAPASEWFFVQTIGGANKAQVAAAVAGSGSDPRVYRRRYLSNVWEPWYRLRWSEAELDARYLGLSGGTMTGALSVVSGGNLQWGTWTPVATPVSNIDAVTVYESPYLRVGDRVIGAIVYDQDATATGAFQWRASLPVPSAFGNPQNAAGVIGSSGSAGKVIADVASDELMITGGATQTSNWASTAFFIYRVL